MKVRITLELSGDDPEALGIAIAQIIQIAANSPGEAKAIAEELKQEVAIALASNTST